MNTIAFISGDQFHFTWPDAFVMAIVLGFVLALFMVVKRFMD